MFLGAMTMEPDKKGKTLWEMLLERVHGNGNGAGIAFANPLDLRVGSAVPVAYANGPEFADYDFTAQEIREYNRRIGGQEFRFTDYVLRGINTKSPDADDTLSRPAARRAQPGRGAGLAPAAALR